MKARLITVGLCLMIGVLGSAEEHSQVEAEAMPMVTTSNLVIHLQTGFVGQNTTISVDGRPVYKGKPHTNPVIGYAGGISTTNISAQPWVRFITPTVTWSNKIDLAKGRALGFNVVTNGVVKVLQSTNFYYD